MVFQRHLALWHLSQAWSSIWCSLRASGAVKLFESACRTHCKILPVMEHHSSRFYDPFFETMKDFNIENSGSYPKHQSHLLFSSHHNSSLSCKAVILYWNSWLLWCHRAAQCLTTANGQTIPIQEINNQILSINSSFYNIFEWLFAVYYESYDQCMEPQKGIYGNSESVNVPKNIGKVKRHDSRNIKKQIRARCWHLLEP